MANRTSRTPQRDGKFLRALSAGHTVSAAAALVGYVRRTVYDWKRADREFAAAWTDAVDEAVDRLEAEADRRAVEGVTKPVFWKGVEVGQVRDYSDTLLMFRLKALRPEKYRDRAPEPPQTPREAPRDSASQIDVARRLAFILNRGVRLARGQAATEGRAGLSRD